VRVRVERGSTLYSAVIPPLPEPFIKPGTLSSIDAVQITRVLPISISAEPSAVEIKSGTMFTGRICSGTRLSERKNLSLLFFNVYQLNLLNRTAQKFTSEPSKFFYRISRITAQVARCALSPIFAEKLYNFSGCRFS